MKVLFVTVFYFVFQIGSDGWRAVPANEAMYASKSYDVGRRADSSGPAWQYDHLLPRTYAHSIYKFGYCTPDAMDPVWLKGTLNISLGTLADAKTDYIYALTDVSWQRYRLQCVILKLYVPKKYLFINGRLPLAYCQGQIFIFLLMTVQRLSVHEFYIKPKLFMPTDIYLEFYHPPFL